MIPAYLGRSLLRELAPMVMFLQSWCISHSTAFRQIGCSLFLGKHTKWLWLKLESGMPCCPECCQVRIAALCQWIDWRGTLDWVLVSKPRSNKKTSPFSWALNSFTRNEAQEQHSLLDTIFHYIFCFGPLGKYLYLSLQNPLHVGRRSRPTCSRFSWLFYRYFPGGPR